MKPTLITKINDIPRKKHTSMIFQIREEQRLTNFSYNNKKYNTYITMSQNKKEIETQRGR